MYSGELGVQACSRCVSGITGGQMNFVGKIVTYGIASWKTGKEQCTWRQKYEPRNTNDS